MAAATSTAAATANEAELQRKRALDLELDETKVQGAVSTGQGEVYILQWLSKAEAALKVIDSATLITLQPKLEASLLKLVNISPAPSPSDVPSSPATPSTPRASLLPKPGRPARHLLARCLLLCLTRGDSRSLYDTMQSLLRTAGDETKGRVPEKETKAAALYVAGEIFGALGQNVMSLFLDLTVLAQKVFRNASQTVLVRYHALLCLSKALLAGGRSLNDAPGKELVKTLRVGLADRAGAVVRGCAECLLVLSQQSELLALRSDVEAILSASFKAFESADFVTKRAVSRLCAGLLAGTQQENSAPPPEAKKTSKKKKKEGAEEDSDEDEAPVGASEGPARTMLTPQVMLDQLLQPYARNAGSRRTRTAILDVYATLFASLGSGWVQANYGVVLKHLIDDLPATCVASNRADVLGLRTGVGLILRRVIGERMLGEQAQVAALQEISSAYLKRWPVLMPGHTPPAKNALVLALDECAGLLSQLGSAPAQVHDALYEPLLRCLAHPSHSVQICAAWCLRTLCSINPAQLTTTLSAVLELLKKDLAQLGKAAGRGGADLPRRTNGHARGVAALINLIPRRALYTSFDVSSAVFSLATDLLKRSAEHDLPVSAVEIQVAWTLIGSLMSLGPNFVRLHLAQLQNLWRNALPKPASKDVSSGPSSRSDAEWGFLLHVRECALGAIYAFLIHNAAALLTLDASRRIIGLLSNSLAFANGFTAQHPHVLQEQVPGAERQTLSLLDREHMVRRRIFQCFTELAPSAAMETLAEGLLPAALQAFAEPDRYVGSAAQAAIAASAGNFTSLWNVSDGYAYGVTSLQRDEESFIASGTSGAYPATKLTARAEWLNRDTVEVQLDALQRRPVLGAPEHDPLILYARPHSQNSSVDASDAAPLPPPPVTAMVDAALELFAALLPYQARETQISALEALLAHCRSPRLEKNPGRRMAVQVNACVGVLGALRTATSASANGAGARRAAGFNNERLTSALREILKDSLLQGDLALRHASSEAYGRLAAVAGSQAMSSQVQFLVDQVVSNRDPDARAGCALAFGAIYSEVGGLAAGPLTKTVVNILMSLSSDPHPTVHYSALEALRMVVDAASLSYSPFVASTLGMLVKLYMLDTHEPEGGSAGSGNLRADLPAHQAACRVISALIGVLGPDLQDQAKVRSLILTLLHEFALESDDGVVVESTKATQHFGLFASEHLDAAAWIAQLRTHLRSSKRPLKLAAINGFYQLVQRQALVVSRVGGDALVGDFFAQLDNDPTIDGVREVLLSWLRQTADLSPSSWIDLCQRIMSRVATTSGAAQGDVKAAPASQQPGMLQDEEAAAIDLGADAKSSGAQQSRWRTQLFALQCLHEVFLTVRRSGRLEHFDTPRAEAQQGQQRQVLMSSRVNDLIKMAFTASTAANAEIRLEGLTVLRDVVQNFKGARDPDFEEALLLEQHQAPIAAALTPAFLSDSTPEVLSAAVQVCAVFVGSGVVREVDRMGRILKLLASALESCMDPAMDSLGEVKGLSPNATAMLKIAVFTAWGELQVSSVAQDYLVDVVKPHVPDLAPFWIASLREFARMRTDPDSASLAMPGPGPVVNAHLDPQYAGLTREVLLPHYESSWYKMLHAISVLMEHDDPAVLRAMDGESTTGEAKLPSAFREEPALNFWPLYGLAFEALANNAGSPAAGSSEAAQEVQRKRVAIKAMRSLSRAQCAGAALLQATPFEELINLCFRIVMTEPLAVQLSIVDMLSSLVRSYAGRLFDAESTDGQLLPDAAKLTQCMRIVIYVMSQSYMQAGAPDEKTALLRSAYSAFLVMLSAFPKGLQEDLLCVAFSTYCDLLHEERLEVDIVGPTLSSLKDVCERVSAVMREGSDTLPRAIHGFLSSALNNVDELRARAGKAVELKTRNSLLVVTIVLTSLPPNFEISTSVVEHYTFLLLQKLRSPDADFAVTAVNCIRGLVLASARGAPSLRYAVGQLLPGLVEHLASGAAAISAPDMERTDRRIVVAEEVMKIMTVLATSTPETHRSRMLGIVLPTFILLLSDATPPSVPHALAVAQLLAIATAASAAFKEAASVLEPEKRTLLETSVRNALTASGAGARQTAAPTRKEAKIELRSFG